MKDEDLLQHLKEHKEDALAYVKKTYEPLFLYMLSQEGFSKECIKGNFRKDPQFQLGLHAQYQRQQRWFQYPYQSFVHQEHDSVGMTSSQYSTYNYRIFIFDQNSTQFLE